MNMSTNAAQVPATRDFAFEFTGRTGEYFRIWIVNIALSILTLGIYSAWATVRSRRYFYAHTRVAGTPFEYHASPLPILIGRLIAVALLALVTFGQIVSPLLALVSFLLLFTLFPALIVRSLRFRAHYSAWRGVRFRFTGGYGAAYRYFLGAWLLLPFTLGLLFPAVRAWQERYIATGHRFGGQNFEQGPLTRSFYGTYFSALGVGFAGLLVVLLSSGVTAVLTGSGELQPGEPPHPAMVAVTLITVLTFYLLMFGVAAFVHSRIRNSIYNTSHIGDHGFRSTLSARTLIWLYFSNALAMLATLGFAHPWARVRLARYRASCLTLTGPDDFDHFVAEAASAESAIGDEVGNALFDFGF